jgi:hypothetical protein
MSEPDYWQKNGLIKPDPWIVCAANRHKVSGRLICGARHWDSAMRGQKLESEKWYDFEQGFLNQFAEFLTRQEAWIIAEKNGQIKRKVSVDGVLYSENIY